MNKAYQEVLSEIKRRKDDNVTIGLVGKHAWWYDGYFNIVMSMSDSREPDYPGEWTFVCYTMNGKVI